MPFYYLHSIERQCPETLKGRENEFEYLMYVDGNMDDLALTMLPFDDKPKYCRHRVNAEIQWAPDEDVILINLQQSNQRATFRKVYDKPGFQIWENARNSKNKPEDN